MSNRIGEILQELSTLQGERMQNENTLKTNNERSQQLTTEWQGICSHPKEYLDEQEDGSSKCCACGFIIVKDETD